MKNVLVVDDSVIQIIILERIFLKKGYQVFKASNGHDAYEILQETKIDVLITDIFMPEIDGVELIMKAKELDKYMGIIAISGGGHLVRDVSYLEYVKQLGADFSFTKPVDEQDILAAVESLFKK